MEMVTVLRWTKFSTVLTGGNQRRRYKAPIRLCFICILILIVLQFKNTLYVTGVWLPFQQTLVSNGSTVSFGGYIKKIIYGVVDTNVTDTGVEDTKRVNTWAKPVDGDPMIVLFSSWEYSKEKYHMHKKVLQLWGSWRKDMVRPVIYSSSDTARQMAVAAGWDVRPIIKVNPDCHGPPLLKGLFADAFENFKSFLYGYANADIVFGEGLIKTLKYIQSRHIWHTTPLLIVGRRHNFPFTNNTIPLDTPADVKSITNLGELVIRSTDYFFTNSIFPWHALPPMSIGRPYVVRAVIGYAIKKHMAVIDATKTIEAVHLTTSDGDRASWHKPGVLCNKRLLNKGSFHIPLWSGHCECVRSETYTDTGGHVHIRGRKPDRNICKQR